MKDSPAGIVFRRGVAARLRLRHLQCFLAVARLRRLRAAAEALAITQPAVTKTLNELEDIVGTPLLRRERRGVSLTAAGVAFEAHAAEGLAALAQALESVQSNPVKPVLRLGVLPTVAPALLAPAVESWQGQHPGVTLHVVEANNAQLMEQLGQQQIDAAVARLADPSEMSGVAFEFLYAEPLVVVTRPGHPLLQSQSAIKPNAMKEYRLVLPPAGTLIRHGADSFLAAQLEGQADILAETMSVSVARSLVQTSDAIWLTAPSAVAMDLASGQLFALPFDTTGTEEPVGLLQRSGEASSPALADLLDALRAVAAQRRLERALAVMPSTAAPELGRPG